MGVLLAVAIVVIGILAGLLWIARRRVGEARACAAADVAAADAAVAAAVVEGRRLSEALVAVHEGVVIADAAGAVVYRNPAAERYHGARRSDAVAEDLLERQLQRALAGETTEQELSLFGPPRSSLVVSAAPMVSTEGVIGAVAVVRDVTELRRVEQVRRDFVANVSHELKTPIGALELLAETVASCDDAAVQRRLAEQMVTEADRLARIVDDLLDLSLIEAQETPNRERMPVRVLVDEAVERVRALALARQIPLRVDAIDSALIVSCDATRVVGAIMNLLDNAVKYSDEGGSVEVGAVADGDRVVVTVADHGIGIPASDLERVFERFYRVDKARSRMTGGTGLGLSIVRHVAHAHGGDVTVTSREGAGSTFSFSLPAAEAPARSPDLVLEGS